jgi:hypothetical protein
LRQQTRARAEVESRAGGASANGAPGDRRDRAPALCPAPQAVGAALRFAQRGEPAFANWRYRAATVLVRRQTSPSYGALRLEDAPLSLVLPLAVAAEALKRSG